MPQYHNATLQGNIEAAPAGPGCYLFHDAMGNIIYVGKSIRLRDRVRSYFVPSARDDERTAPLVQVIRDVAYVQTETELDALMAEYRLIKRHKPWFNAQHIRSLRPHFIRVGLSGPHPTAVIVQDGAGACLGPLRDVHRAQETLQWMNAIWRTPLCGRTDWPEGARPCLYHGMGRCPAPCTRPMDAAPSPILAELSAFVAGDAQPTAQRLQRDMAAAASALRFEEALAIKQALDHLAALARRVAHGLVIQGDTHAIVLMRGFGERELSAFYCKEGRILGRLRMEAGATAESAADALALAIATGDLQATPPGTEACICEISAWRRFARLPQDAPPETIRAACLALCRAAGEG